MKCFYHENLLKGKCNSKVAEVIEFLWVEQAKLKVISSKAIAQRVSDLVKLSKDVSCRSVSTTSITFPRKADKG